MSYGLNRAAVDAEVARRRAIREHGFGRWIATRLAVSLAAFYALALVARWMSPTASFAALSGWSRTVFIVVPAIVAFFVTAAAERLMFSDAALDAERLSARIAREVQSLTADGWPLRTLRAALVLALCVGIPLAIVVFMTGRPMAIARASDASIAVFVSAVLIFSVAAAFAIRAATLHVYRSLLTETAPDQRFISA
jgi:hypothetical protein